MNRLFLLAALTVSPVGFALADPTPGKPPFLVEKDSVDLSPAANVTIKDVRVDNRLGDVSIIGMDVQGITITVEKRAADEATLERLKVNLVPDPSGRVDISTVLLAGPEMARVPAGSVRVDVTVLVPKEDAVGCSVERPVSATGLLAGATLSTHEGISSHRVVGSDGHRAFGAASGCRPQGAGVGGSDYGPPDLPRRDRR